MNCILASVLLTLALCTASRTACSQDTLPAEPDTVCFSIQQVRELVDGFVLGEEGFNALSFERRLHARTAADRNTERNKAAALFVALGQERIATDERTTQRDGWKLMYEGEHRKKNGWKVAAYVLGALLLGGAGYELGQ